MLSNADLALTHWPPVAGHVPLPCLLLLPSAAFGCFIPVSTLHARVLPLLPPLLVLLSIFFLSSMGSQDSLQHDTCLLPRGTRTFTFHALPFAKVRILAVILSSFLSLTPHI